MTMNSTISELMQDNSTVSPETNPVSSVQNDGLIFGQKHNDIDCALCPTAKRACDRAWVTAKNVEVWSKMSTTTLWRWLGKLEKARRIQSFSDMKKIKIDDENGRGHETTLYNLNVLNQLAMVCIDNEKLNEVSCKFSDILSEVETTGSYSIRKPDSYMIEDKIERAKRWIEETEEWQKALSSEETAHAETKALLAEEKEHSDALEAQNKALTAERDEAIRTKAQIGDKKVATAMGTAGALSKKCDRLEKEVCELKSEMELQIYNACKAVRKEFEEAWITARDWCYNHQLTVKVNEPKWAVSAKLTEICEAYPGRDQWRRDARGTKLFPKWACDILDKVYDEDSTFLSEYRIV